jgi:hypothetical protein
MQASSTSYLTVALATIRELPDVSRTPRDAEREASRVAANRAIRGIVGSRGSIEVRRRVGRAPLAFVRDDSGRRHRLSLSLTHCDGRAAAAAAPAGSRVGIDLENLEAIDPARERFFLTARERSAVAGASSTGLWAMKEAVWKAMELDARVGFHELELEIDAGGVVRGARFRGTRVDVHMHLTSPWPGYVLAVAQLGRVS